MILATGASGQVGSVLARTAGVIAIDVADLDLAAPDRVDDVLDNHRPHAVINTAAYTGVDRAEEQRDLAFAINATGAGRLAEACARRGIAFVQISTDYVFDGTATRPYLEDDATNPLNVYGASKAEGERLVLAAGGTVMRTSWVFSSIGANFVKTIVRLATERPEIRIVADQHGCPTHAAEVARMALALVERPVGIYHACGDGPTTWHGFAEAIVAEAGAHRSLACERVVPIATADYPTPAKRPLWSILDTSKVRSLGIVPAPWRDGLRVALQELLA